MNKWLLSFLTVIVTVLICSFLPHKLMAQGRNFSNVVPFTATTGLGFFDQSNGKIYIYDNNLRTCVFTGQLSDLSNPIVKLSGN